MRIATKFGFVEVGDKVKIRSRGGTAEAKIVGPSLPGGVDVYMCDITGCHHETISISDVIEIIKEEEISKPKRYNKVGKLECWDVIIDQEMDFLEGSIMKYLWRHKEKNGIHDLKKAVEYLNKMIGDYEKLYGKR